MELRNEIIEERVEELVGGLEMLDDINEELERVENFKKNLQGYTDYQQHVSDWLAKSNELDRLAGTTITGLVLGELEKEEAEEEFASYIRKGIEVKEMIESNRDLVEWFRKCIMVDFDLLIECTETTDYSEGSRVVYMGEDDHGLFELNLIPYLECCGEGEVGMVFRRDTGIFPCKKIRELLLKECNLFLENEEDR